MFLPLDRGIDWRNPPVATLGLAALCVLTFLVFQLDDRAEEQAAFEYYYDSGLAAIELPAYRAWLREQGRREALVKHYGDAVDERHGPWYRAQLRDQAFQDALESGAIIGPSHEAYRAWQRKRAQYERLLAARTVTAWGMKPERLNPVNMVTHQFLHGGWMHLIGNMVFLVAVGLLVEAVAGSSVTLLIYVLGGVGAASAFMLANPQAAGPLVGASGSISALMGAMAVGYGLNRVRVFIHLGIYLDYRRVPALVLLVPWLGYEWLKLHWYGDQSAVAYTAHMGGLVAGAALMVPVRLVDGRVAERARPSQEQGEPVDTLLARADRAAARLDVEDAQADYQRVLETAPSDPRALKGLYDCRRLKPESQAYHEVARAILELTTPQASAIVREVYADYRQRARPKPRLPASTLHALTRRFMRERDLAEAERLFYLMSQRPEAFSDLRDRVGDLIRLLRESGQEDRAAAWARFTKELE